MASLLKKTALAACLLTIVFTALYHTVHIGVFLTLAITFGTIAYHFLMRLIVGLIYNVILHNSISPDKRWFHVSKAELRFYDFLRVNRWKKHIPTYDSSLFDPRSHTWNEIAGAMCQAELVHETIIPLCFLPVIASEWFGVLPVFLITSILSACVECIFVILQRYNRPRVLMIAARMEARRKKQ